MEDISEAEAEETEEKGPDEQEQPAKSKTDDERRRWSVVAQKILMEAVVAGDSDETLNRLKMASDKLVSNKTFVQWLCVGSRDDALVRALASHQCGPGSIPGLGVSELQVLKLYNVPK